jgi:hypothetical protein
MPYISIHACMHASIHPSILHTYLPTYIHTYIHHVTHPTSGELGDGFGIYCIRTIAALATISSPGPPSWYRGFFNLDNVHHMKLVMIPPKWNPTF